MCKYETVNPMASYWNMHIVYCILCVIYDPCDLYVAGL